MATELRLQLVARPALIAKVAPTFTKNIVAGTGIGVSYTSPTYTINLDIAALTTDPAILTTEITNIYTAIYDSSAATYSKASLSVIRDAIVSGGAGLGDVVGPSSATDNAVVRFDLATGKIIQNSAVIVDDSNNVSGIGTLASGAHAITSASANALAVGLAGTTNPALKVDASAATSVTGVKISSAATGGGAFLAAIGDVNTQLNIDAAGSGTIRLADTSTGAVEFGTNAVPQTSDGAALGTTALKWSDAFLASGAVLNFDSGDVTVTHAANTLTFAGATSGYQFGELIAPSANDGAPIGSATLQWSDLFLASGAVINYANGDAVLTHSAGILTVSTGDLRVTTAGTNAASVATLGGTQTLTAKTLTAPVLSGATAHGVLHASGTGVITATAEMTDGQILVGQTGADPLPKTLSGDATLSAAGALTIANDAVTYAKMQNVSVTARILGRTTAGAGDVEECTLSEVLDFVGSAAQGDILVRGAASWARLGAGTTGQFLQTQGAGGNPQWTSVPGGGDMLASNNLSDVADADTSLINLSGMRQGFRNYLLNPSGVIEQTAAGSVADGAYLSFDQWLALTQTAAVADSQVTNAENGTPYMMRLTQSQAAAQRFGFIQWIESRDCINLRGKTMVFSCRARLSTSANLRMAIVEWTGTADSITKDIVNDWTSATYTTGNFFTAASTTVTAVSAALAVTATTLTTLSVSGTVGSSATNIACFIWTESTAAQNVTLDIGKAQLEIGSTATLLDLRPANLELLLCQRYFRRIVSGTAHYFLMMQCFSTTQAFGAWALVPEMRSAPTLTVSAASHFSVFVATTPVACTALTNGGATTRTQRIDITVAAGLTANNATILSSQNASALLDLNSRL